MTTAPRSDVADRHQRIRRGALRGLVGGLLWSVPVGLLCALSMFTVRAPVAEQWNLAFQTFAYTVLTWVSIAASVGAQRAREDALPEEYRRLLRAGVLGAIHQALLFAGPVVLFAVFTTWMYGPVGAILSGLMILGIWLGSAAAVGHARASSRVAKLLAQERAEVELFLRSGDSGDAGEPWDSATLARKRRTVADALAKKFGDDAARRERVQTWDQARIAEVARKLPDAATLAEAEA